MHQEIVASLRGATKTFGKLRALDGIDLDVRAGETLALLGPNGAGKTTAIKLLLGLARPTAGKAVVFGGDPTERRVRVRIGTMLQVASLPATLTVREHVDLFSSYYPRPLALAETIEIAELGGLERRAFGKLSGGQRQRLLFALAICGDPDLLVLDEPTVGLDVATRRLVWDRLRELVRRGKSLLLTTHYLAEADALADRVSLLAGGRIVAEGTPDEIKSRASGATVRCATSLDIAEIRALPAVDTVRVSERCVEIRTPDADTVIRALYAQDASFRLIDVTNVALEDAFLALTGEAA